MNAPNPFIKKANLLVVFVAGCFLAFSGMVHAQESAFTYQGRLIENNAPANGTYEFEFMLYPAASGGTFLGVNTLEETPVSNGLFTVTLDFGAEVFDGQQRWLEIQVRNDNGGGFAVLSPRQPLTSVPYAIAAGRSISASNLLGELPASQLTGTLGSNQIANASISSGKILDGSILNADIANAAGIVDTKLGTISTAGKVANSATTASSVNSSNTIVLRNGSGSFSANFIEATGFAGGGSDLYGLDADNINYGTLDNARLSSSVTQLGQTIEPHELAKPYQSGTINSAKPETAFWRMTYPVTFPQPFASVPNVTLGLNCSDLSILETIKVSVTSKSTTGFTASALIPVPSVRQINSGGSSEGGIAGISVNGTPGVFYYRNQSGVASNEITFSTLTASNWQSSIVVSNVSLSIDSLSGAMIQGRPAAVYVDETGNTIKFVRAANAQGTAWGSSVNVGVGSKPYLLEVGQRPAIAYIGTNGLRYVRANDSTGSSWGSGVIVDTNCNWPSLAIINGNPAIAAHRGSSGAGLMFYRSTDTNGTAWSAPIVVQTNVIAGPGQMFHGYYSTLTTVNGRPAIAYLRGPDTIQIDSCYIRANDANGTSWGTPHEFPISAMYGSQTLVVADGRPAICVNSFRSPRFIHATDVDGNDWGPVITLDPVAVASGNQNVNSFDNLAMEVIDGMPHVFYNQHNDGSTIRNLKVIRATVPDFQIDWTAIAP